jgi:gas vesicle protein
MSTGKVVLGTVAGLAIGGILGILFAPEKGSVTRQQILDKSDECMSDLKSKISDIAASVKEKIETVKNETQQLAENGRVKFDEVKNDMDNLQN